MNELKRKILIGGILIASATPVFASEEGVVRARIGLSSNDFSTIWSGGDLKTDYISLNFGVTYITPNAFYFDLGVKQDTSASWNTVELNEGFNDGKDEDYSRDDITLTIGKALDNGVQIFAGYQDSSANITLPNIWVESGYVEEEEIDVNGFFVGVGKSFKIGEGSFNLNASYGWMDGTLVDANGNDWDSTDGGGYSLGASYTRFLTESISLNLELKRQKYSYDYDTEGAIILTSGDDQMTMVGVNLVYQF
jgi:hypothetical protein